VDANALAADLREPVSGGARFTPAIALYATDRQNPIGVIVPRTLDDIVNAVGVLGRA
jgi:hypothetical protein